MADFTVSTDLDTFMQSADKPAMRTNMDLGTAATKDVAATGDAASGEVVKGDDTRLTDARTPTSHTHTASEVTDFDTEVANNTTVAANTSKLSGIEAGAEVNNISDTNATDLTDGGDSTLHYHSSDRNRANHTGTQTLSTISDAGTIANQDANSVTITGGSVTGITDLAVADGGTGASTAAAARTNLEVYSDAEVDAKVATKAVAGGGITDGNLGKIEILKDSNFEPTQDFSFSFDFKLITMPTSGTNSFLLINGTGSQSVAIVFNVLNQFTFWFRDSSTNAIYGGTLSTANDLFGSWHSVALVSDTAAQTLTLYLDNKLYGVQNVSSINISQITSGNSFYLGNGSSSALGANAAFKNFRHFNRALSASEVADLYESGTVAVADRWAPATPLWSTWESYGSISGVTVTSSTPTSFNVVKDTSTVALRARTDDAEAFSIESGKTYRIQFDLEIVSGSNQNLIVRLNDDGNVGSLLSANYSIAWASGSYDFEVVATASSSTAVFYIAGNTNSNAAEFNVSNFKIVGCIADLPLDEGIGYQFHDRSSNHFDALASTSGVTHLVPKQTGKLRVKAADASSATYMLRADSILPADSVITNILAEERNIDLERILGQSVQTLDDYRIRLNPSGSDLQIQRSDGSNHSTLCEVTAPSSLSDVDVQIHYEQVAR